MKKKWSNAPGYLGVVGEIRSRLDAKPSCFTEFYVLCALNHLVPTDVKYRNEAYHWESKKRHWYSLQCRTTSFCMLVDMSCTRFSDHPHRFPYKLYISMHFQQLKICQPRMWIYNVFIYSIPTVVFELSHFYAVYGHGQRVFWCVFSFWGYEMDNIPDWAGRGPYESISASNLAGFQWIHPVPVTGFRSTGIQQMRWGCKLGAMDHFNHFVSWLFKARRLLCMLRSSEQVDLGWSKAFPFYWHGRQLYHLEQTCGFQACLDWCLWCFGGREVGTSLDPRSVTLLMFRPSFRHP